MPFYDFTRGEAKEFSLAELVAKISELERRRLTRGQARDDASGDGSENPWRTAPDPARGDGSAPTDRGDLLAE